MDKIICVPSKKEFKSKGKERITIQLRRYNKNGVYDSRKGIADKTIWITSRVGNLFIL